MDEKLNPLLIPKRDCLNPEFIESFAGMGLVWRQWNGRNESGDLP